ncbi:MAG: O-antigen ligase family protein [Anaerolineales bacterium]|nr:O-antigen ligase family protein [Anaerolineales bacterium]
MRWLSRPLAAAHLAGLALLFNLPGALLGLQRTTFDAYVHVFFADHYRRAWWQLWEPRWYLGFSVASYPPLVHQLIALLAWPAEAVLTTFAPRPERYPGEFRWLGEEAGYVLVLLAALSLLPLAVRAFARLFAGPGAAEWAGRLAALLPAVALTAWSFGQLPTLAGSGLLLLALAEGARFARSGARLPLARAVALAAAAGATHHAVFLFAPAAGLAVAGQVWLTAPPGQRLRAAARLALWAGLSAAAVAAMLWPFLAWSRAQALQTPIDHPSRHNFFRDPAATLFFFWPMAGPLLLLVPAVVGRAFRAARRTRSWAGSPLLLAWALLFVLGLGGTTPLPRWLFGPGWEWLTYDRFGLWAALCLLPAAGGIMLVGWRRGRAWSLALVAALALSSGLAAGLAAFTGAQPPAVDLAPLARFLDEPAQRPYRYLTLGFGDQLARLAAVTENGTLDGTYHTARSLPELQRSGLGALDAALWNPRGVWALRPFLEQAPRYGLRWAFSVRAEYAPVLRAAGWTYRFDVGTAQAWERADVLPVSVSAPPQDPWAARWWGAAPLAGALLALLLMLAGRRVTWAGVGAGLGRLRRGLLIATAALLTVWWAAIVRGGPGDLPHIYFLYQSQLIFASDVTLALALAVWVVERWLRRTPLRLGPRAVAAAGLALLAAVALSIIHSADAGLSAWTAGQFVLLAGLYLMLVNDPPHPAAVGRLAAVLIAAQAGLAVVQAAAQSTAGLDDLFLRWPGALTAETRGASVVLNAAGARWLRAYGSLPHPNILGALLALGLGAVWERWLSTGRRRWLGALALAAVALALTFSRAAWLGAGATVLALSRLAPDAGRVRRAAVAGALGLAVVLLPLAPYLLSRLGAGGGNPLEQASTLERSLLIGYGLEAWRAQPLTGVGLGAFVQWAARHASPVLPFEPVHNVPLLILAETGLLGLAAALALAGAWAGRVWRRPANLPAAAWAAALLGAGVIGLLDHVWWTQAPARTLLVMALGVWAGAETNSPAPGGAGREG